VRVCVCVCVCVCTHLGRQGAQALRQPGLVLLRCSRRLLPHCLLNAACRRCKRCYHLRRCVCLLSNFSCSHSGQAGSCSGPCKRKLAVQRCAGMPPPSHPQGAAYVASTTAAAAAAAEPAAGSGRAVGWEGAGLQQVQHHLLPRPPHRALWGPVERDPLYPSSCVGAINALCVPQPALGIH